MGRIVDGVWCSETGSFSEANPIEWTSFENASPSKTVTVCSQVTPSSLEEDALGARSRDRPAQRSPKKDAKLDVELIRSR